MGFYNYLYQNVHKEDNIHRALLYFSERIPRRIGGDIEVGK